MKKKYKDRIPQDTIGEIRNFLSSVGALLREQSWCKYDFYACRLTLSNAGLSSFDIGTNGKGRTYEYALASGYGEFMERFQNRILIEPSFIQQMHELIHQDNSSLGAELKNIGVKSEFIFDPEERIENTALAINDLKVDGVRLFSEKVEDNEEIENLILQNLGNANSIMVPFYSVKDNKELFCPLSFVIVPPDQTGCVLAILIRKRSYRESAKYLSDTLSAKLFSTRLSHLLYQ